jgi:hypothetical protein
MAGTSVTPSWNGGILIRFVESQMHWLPNKESSYSSLWRDFSNTINRIYFVWSLLSLHDKLALEVFKWDFLTDCSILSRVGFCNHSKNGRVCQNQRIVDSSRLAQHLKESLT